WDQPNTPPVITVDSAHEILEDTSLDNVPVTVFDAETAPAALGISVTSLNPALVPPANVTLTGSGTNWMLDATPVANGFGTAIIEIAVTDAHGITVTNQLQLHVLPVNDPPAFTGGPNLLLPEDAGPQTLPAWATGVTAGPANESLQLLAF